jgi:hypothetical protein
MQEMPALLKGSSPDTKEVNGLAVHFRGNSKIGVKGELLDATAIYK